MWMVFVHCIVSLIDASMGNTLPANNRNCLIDDNNLPGRSWPGKLGEEGWKCTYLHPEDNVRRCIPFPWLCDGNTLVHGCGGGEDEGEVCGGYGEEDRTCTNPFTGKADMWRCRSGTQSCIYKSWLCTGGPACEDGEDEGEICGGYGEQDYGYGEDSVEDRSCTNPFTGEAKSWRCRSGSQSCISNHKLCKGWHMCDDGEDDGEICGGHGEHDRTCTNPFTKKSEAWRCKSGSQLCIPEWKLCDGYQDCEDGEDEGEICGGYGKQDRTCTNPMTGEADHWRCRSGSQLCILKYKLCNGRQDCADGEDEGAICGGYGEEDRNCTNPFTGKADHWRCTSGTQSCIPYSWLCSASQSCEDGEDEGEICGGYGEQDRTCTSPITGEAVGWRCKSGSQLCIDKKFLCNGRRNCDDGEDEGENCG